MAKYKYIPCDIYKRGVNVFIGTPDEMQAWAKKRYTEDEYKDFLKELEECSYGYADTHLYDGSIIVRIPLFPKSPAEIAALEHELLHATFYLLSYSGIQYDASSPNEAFTYLLEWLTREVLTEENYETC